jgi:hypothetical protein
MDLRPTGAAEDAVGLVRAGLEHAEDDAAVAVEELGCSVVRNDANVFGHAVLLSRCEVDSTSVVLAADDKAWRSSAVADRVKRPRTVDSSSRRARTLTTSPWCNRVSGWG